ncbi:MAG: UDP-N-acetylglucosamine 2-epimerase (non-hydrolyzing) [Firmicutes bacterium]|nr:UDP-N-acetylglucosamine 2-epimerase (non-hydrolyzing) [Bacillota bacterium]
MGASAAQAGGPRVVCVFGTRPEAIKMAPVVRALQARPALDVRIVLTAQHRQLLDQVMEQFGLAADADLDLMRPGQPLEELTARALLALHAELGRWSPDLVLVHGDTTTTLAGALAAFYRRIPVGHVEAGLRSFRLDAPFPEEANRLLTDRLSALHFAPTPRARQNLLREGIPAEGVLVTGNTAIDALLWTVEHARKADVRAAERLLGSWSGRLVLAETHRRESWEGAIEEVARAVADAVQAHSDVLLLYSVHPNPLVRQAVRRATAGRARVRLVEPQPYGIWAQLMRRAHLVVTDSGGIQEEAPSLHTPVVLAREVSERPEGVEAGTVHLAGTGYEGVRHLVDRLLSDPEAWRRSAEAPNPFGDGRAAERIAQAVEWRLTGRAPRPEEFRPAPRSPAAGDGIRL